MFASQISSKPPTPGSAKSNLNVLGVLNVSSSLYDKANDSTVTNFASMALEQPKLTKPPTAPSRACKSDTKPDRKVVFKQKQPAAPRAGNDTKLDQKELVKQKQQPTAPRAANDTKLDQQLFVKQKQHVAQHAKSSKKAPASCVWGQLPNLDFLFGQQMLTATEVDKAGPGCVALHAHYMNARAQIRKTLLFAMVTHEHFLN